MLAIFNFLFLGFFSFDLFFGVQLAFSCFLGPLLFLFYAPPHDKLRQTEDMQMHKLTGVLLQNPLFIHPVFTLPPSPTGAAAANTPVQHNAELWTTFIISMYQHTIG